MHSTRNQRALLLYAVLGLLVMSGYRYHLNPDAIGYVSVALKYARGDCIHALNFYWAPLLSWLLIPFIRLHIDPLLAIRIIQYAAGIVLFFLVRRLASLFPIRPEIRSSLFFILVPLTIYFAYAWVTPDLLYLCLFTAIFCVTADPRYPESRTAGLLAGALGACSYFARSLAFYFFPLHFALVSALWILQGADRRRIFMHLGLGLAAFGIVAAPWVTAISDAHGGWTISEAGKVNRTNDGVLVAYADLPIYSRGLMPPPDSSAISAWDDPSLIPRADWSPLDSLATLRLQLKAVVFNIIKFFTVIIPFFWLLPALVLFYVLLAFPLRTALDERPIVLFTLTAIGLVFVGYVPFLIEVRYFWPIVPLLLMMAGHLLSSLINHGFLTPVRSIIATSFVAASFVVMPLWAIVPQYGDGVRFHDQSVQIGDQLKLRGKRVAADRWKPGLYFSYYTGARYYGQPKLGATEKEAETDLLKNKIEYYVVWGEAPKSFTHYRLLSDPAVKEVKVFVRQ